MTTQMEDTLTAMQVLLSARVPIVLWGDPGTGKTATIQQFSNEAGWHMETVMASVNEPTDIGGLPVRSPDGVILEPPLWAKRVAACGKEALVFFDEVNTAAPATQNALMHVVLTGHVGQFSLGKQVRFIAAANPPERNAGAWDLSAPLANRFAHLRWPVDFDTWRDGYLRGWPTIAPLDVEPPSDRRRSYQRALQTAFLARRQGWLCKVPDDDTAASAGWPSPRTWEWTAECFAIADHAGASQSVFALIAEALLGAAAATEYMAYIRDLDLPDPEALIADPDSFVLPSRDDQKFACLDAVAVAVISNCTAKRWKAAFTVCIRAAERGSPDIAAAAARTLVAGRPSGARLPEGWEVFEDLLAATPFEDVP